VPLQRARRSPPGIRADISGFGLAAALPKIERNRRHLRRREQAHLTLSVV
jgi:hypothetical protein